MNNHCSKNENIICFANDWNSDPTSKHQVVKILSRDRKVLWINSISMRSPKINKSDVTRIFQKIYKFFRGVEKISNNLLVFTPIVLPFPKYSIIRTINFYILLFSIKYFVKKFEMSPFQLWTFVPTMVDLVGKLNESKVVYYCVDEWSKFSFLDSVLMRNLEYELLCKSDFTITTAKSLQSEKQKFAKNCFLVPHGVDWNHFSQALAASGGLPKDIIEIEKPIIGFFGLIHEWLDLDLIAYLAKERPQWNFVLIGKCSVEMSMIKKFKNIHLLGQKSYSMLPDYCKAMDVALIPFKLNELTVHVNPIKLREYLAAGLSVVSTNLPEVQQYSHLVKIGNTNTEFLDKIEECLQENSNIQKLIRSDSMKSETWEAKVGAIIARVNE